MSLMDIAQLLGNLGEFVGAIVILATLIYLAMQVRQNTNALHAQSGQAVLSSAQAGLFAMMENPDVHLSIVKTDSLTPKEHVKLHFWLASFMRLREFAWLQYQNGIIDDVQWSTELVIIRSVLSSHRLRDWWDSVGRNIYGARFAEFVDDALRDQPITNEVFERMTNWTNP
jgi:uncharacterized MnhB-related membrane protein